MSSSYIDNQESILMYIYIYIEREREGEEGDAVWNVK